MLLTDREGSFSCSACPEWQQRRRGCSKRGQEPLSTPYWSIPDPRDVARPVQPMDCPVRYVGAREHRWLTIWGHLRAQRDYFGLPAGRWPAKDAAAVAVLSEEVARHEEQEREQASRGPQGGLTGDQLVAELTGGLAASSGRRR
jgi:hypothetical protein